jgi:hypothetical protein
MIRSPRGCPVPTIAAALARAETLVLVVDRDPAAAGDTVDLIVTAGGRAEPAAADLTSEEDLAALAGRSGGSSAGWTSCTSTSGSWSADRPPGSRASAGRPPSTSTPPGCG